MDRQTEFVLRSMEERDIRFVRLWFTDVLGSLKSVAIAPAEVEGAIAEGVGFDGSAIEGFARVYESDMVVHPDPSTFQVLPWRHTERGTARMLCDIQLPDGSPGTHATHHDARRAAKRDGRILRSCRPPEPSSNPGNQPEWDLRPGRPPDGTERF